MPDDFAIIKDALSRIERDKQNSWTEYVELIGAINDLEAELAKLRKVAEAAKMFCRDTSSRGRLDWLCDALLELDKEDER